MTEKHASDVSLHDIDASDNDEMQHGKTSVEIV